MISLSSMTVKFHFEYSWYRQCDISERTGTMNEGQGSEAGISIFLHGFLVLKELD